jgi:hypothetical protein
MSELRITDTNSANDSKGRAFGLEGNDFIFVLVAGVAALGLYLLLNVALHVSMVGALTLALPAPAVTLAWVLGLRHNKPAGYAEDWFDQKLNGEGFSFTSRGQTRSPLVPNVPATLSRHA